MNNLLGIEVAVATAALGLGLVAAVPAGAQTETTVGDSSSGPVDVAIEAPIAYAAEADPAFTG